MTQAGVPASGDGPDRAGPTIADRIRAGRRRRFVGRATEVDRFREALAATEPPFALLYVHGPGGIGKTTLLERLADLAVGAGVTASRVDLGAIEATPAAVLRSLDVAGMREDDTDEEDASALAALAAGGRRVVLLDNHDPASPLDGWLRQRFIPSLPAGAIVVIASRARPGSAWLVDPGWRDLRRVVALRNLTRIESAALLGLEGVPDDLHDAAIDTTHGHPLALALVAELVRQDANPTPDSIAQLAHRPDVVRALLAGIVDATPSSRHADALSVAAIARVVTETLLSEILTPEGGPALFDWLRRLSFVEETPRGIRLHDLARDALQADLRWRNPSHHEHLHRQIRRHLTRRARQSDPAGYHAAVADLVFLNRGNPFAARFWQWRTFGEVHADRLRPHDREPLVAMTALHEGAESAALVEHWLDRQPEAFRVLRTVGSDEPVGFGAILQLHLATTADIAADPGTAAMWRHARTDASAGPDDRVFASRFYLARDTYQGPGPAYNAITVAHTEALLTRDPSSIDYVGLFADPDRIAPLMAYIDFERAPSADFEVGGRRYGTFVHDWRQRDVEAWLDLMARRETTAFEPGVSTAAEAPLSRQAFGQAVRRALRDLHRPDALAANPLAASDLVRNRGGERAEALRAVLEEAVGALAVDPRDARLARAVRGTYLRPARTQELAAEALDLPFSTYKRHLSQGIDRVTAWLWQRAH